MNTATPELHLRLRVPHSLWAFALLPISSLANDCWRGNRKLVSRSTFLYFLFLLHFLQFPVLPVLSRTSPPKILLSMTAPGPSFHIPLPFPPMYVLSLLHFLIPYFPCSSRTSPPKILLSMPAPGPSSIVLPSLLLSYFPVKCCVCTVFFFSFCFTGLFLKNVFVLGVLVFCWFGSCLSYLVVFALNLMHQLGAFERKSPQGFSNYYPVFLYCILG